MWVAFLLVVMFGDDEPRKCRRHFLRFCARTHFDTHLQRKLHLENMALAIFKGRQRNQRPAQSASRPLGAKPRFESPQNLYRSYRCPSLLVTTSSVTYGDTFSLAAKRPPFVTCGDISPACRGNLLEGKVNPPFDRICCFTSIRCRKIGRCGPTACIIR